MLIGVDVEALGRGRVERDQVRRRQITGGVVQEHVFRARVRRADVAGRLAGVPVVHGGVEVQAGIGRRPGGVTDFLPEVARLQGLGDFLVGAANEIPITVRLYR